MPRGRRPTAKCGTPSGWDRHKRQGEKPCDDCASAKREYDARRRLKPEQLLKSRIRATAQIRAYRTLAWRYPDQYRQAYKIEVIRVGEEFAAQLAEQAAERALAERHSDGEPGS
jgi:hypothetical protein